MDSGLETFIIRGFVERALAEDLGSAGDITTRAIIGEQQAEAVLAARSGGVLAGLELAAAAFACLDPQAHFEPLLADGSSLAAGQKIARVRGKARALLSAERVALNFLTHLSGIAAAAGDLAARIAPHKARLCCTRKTTPGLRALEKYAHRAGGGVNHRFGLNDGILIKDNHIALAGGVEAAIKAAKARAGHMMRVEVELDSPSQLAAALAAGADALLLDNMSASMIADLVRETNGRAIIEASGGITPETLPAIAASGADLISTSWTIARRHSVDIALDMEAL